MSDGVRLGFGFHVAQRTTQSQALRGALWLTVAVCCSVQAGARAFKATGNTDPKHRAVPWHKGEVVVTFDTMPTRMSFDLPCYAKMITENDIQYINGATETYIDGFAEGQSYEVWNDRQNVYSRFWIESQNDARIVVRHRNALVRDGKIAHAKQRKVSPYGRGEWTDERFTFHPDGTHTRRVKVYTPAAATSQPWPAQPISRSISKSGGLPEVSVHELEGMYVMGRGPGRLVGDELEKKGLTLIKMDGRHRDIAFDPYPLRLNASGEEMYRAYGDLKHANIHVINTRSTWRPFRIGRPNERVDGPPHFLLLMTPYKPVHRLTNLVPSFPAGATRRQGYFLAGLGQMQYTRYWQVTKDAIFEIWLNGFTRSKEPAEELAVLARSWLRAPTMRLLSSTGTAAYGYDMAARAYLVGVKPGGQPTAVQVQLDASAASPVVNPTFLVNHWGSRRAALDINGTTVSRGKNLRLGHYKALDLEDGRTWRSVLILWVRARSTKPIRFTIRRGGPASVEPGVPFRTWKSAKGTSVEARLVEDTDETVILESRSGQRLEVKRTYLSAEDRQYLDGLRRQR
ncbi:MAG: hypothetical protein ISS72_04810 [Candidatus Brocadiae bacterium]|nr:hypothetical protein [Candidatus Brocadiia bacterium]